MERGFKYRIYPNKQQVDLLTRSLGCGRFIWNQLLNQSIKAYEVWKNNGNLDKPNISQIGLVNSIMVIKREYPWLYDVSSDILQQKARDLGSTFIRFFNGKGKIGYPRFKSKHGHSSVRLTTHAFRFKDNQLYIAKSEDPIKVRWSRVLPNNPSSCTISKTPTGEWYASFVCESEPKLTDGVKVIGIDLGIAHFLTSSDGSKFDNPRHFASLQEKLARLQRQHARKQKGSHNREKVRIKVARIQQQIRNMRNDFLHKLSRTLVNENQVIGIETLRVRNMLRNHSLAKHIADVAWSRFVDYLTYKVRESRHCILVRMESFYPSSHICSVCDTKLDRKLSLSERKWTCACGAVHDRDINAGQNIKKQAIRTVQQLKPRGGAVLLAHDLD
jgi:putative transposase